MLNLPERFVLFDLECTSWEGAAARNWSGPGEHRELVQIAAALVETKGFSPSATFRALVKPRINSRLSDYFIDLTHITQARLDEQGFDFADVLSDFNAWYEKHELYCFDSRVDGSRLFDRDVLVENCELYGLPFPFEMERFHNVNEIFAKHGYVVRQSGASPEVFGIKIPARPHDALNDVSGILISLRALSERLK